LELTSIKGDTCETVPVFFKGNYKTSGFCELVHGSSLCTSDNIDLSIYGGSCGTVVTSTAMDDLQNVVYFGNFTEEANTSQRRYGQWLWLLLYRCIADVRCYEDVSFTVKRDFV